MNGEFKEMHAAMLRFNERCEREGWESPEVKKHARHIQFYLWEIIHNRTPHPTAFSGLAKETEALAKARAASRKPPSEQ